MLTISLRKLARGPVDLEGAVDPDEAPWTDTDLAFRQAPAYELTARETGDGVVHVTGALRAALEVECRRCLTAVPHPVDLRIDWLYDPGLEGEPEEEGVFPLDRESGALDLTPQVREELLLEEPPYPLCRPECEGLCPTCGTNLNEDSCDCEQETGDPRWEQLYEQLEE